MKTDKATPRPCYVEIKGTNGRSGTAVNEGSTVVIGYFTGSPTNHTMENIVEAVNNHSRLLAIESAAQAMVVSGANASRQLRVALASTPAQASEQAARKEEYVKALEAVALTAKAALGVGKFRGSQRADEVASELSRLLRELEILKERK